MKFYYDCEFVEDGPQEPISLISIGIVREDGHSFYAINADAPWRLIGEHEWLMSNVVPSLPIVIAQGVDGWEASWEEDAPVYDRKTIADALLAFVVPPAGALKWTGPSELWGWYADYDHVCLAQLFGRMIDLPAGVPMYTRDLKQEVDLFMEAYPQWRGACSDALAKADESFPTIEHNALEDALQLAHRADAFWKMRKKLLKR